MSLCVRVRVRMKGGEGRNKVRRGLEMVMGVGVGVGVGVRVGFELRVGMRMGQTVTATTTSRFSPFVLHLIFEFGIQRTFKLASSFTSGLLWRFLSVSIVPSLLLSSESQKKTVDGDGKRAEEKERKCKKNERMKK